MQYNLGSIQDLLSKESSLSLTKILFPNKLTLRFQGGMYLGIVLGVGGGGQYLTHSKGLPFGYRMQSTDSLGKT